MIEVLTQSTMCGLDVESRKHVVHITLDIVLVGSNFDKCSRYWQCILIGIMGEHMFPETQIYKFKDN